MDAILIHPLPPPSSEPTSGLDARAAAIVMRTVRNVGNSSRAVVVTIHQPSIEIFEVRARQGGGGRQGGECGTGVWGGGALS